MHTLKGGERGGIRRGEIKTKNRPLTAIIPH